VRQEKGLEQDPITWCAIMVKCSSCEWDGREEELVEEPSGLFLYDYVIAEKIKGDITRSSYLCPRCKTTLQSHRKIDGFIFDGL